jgi:imidazolonepropionase-like amidohydrolase
LTRSTLWIGAVVTLPFVLAGLTARPSPALQTGAIVIDGATVWDGTGRAAIPDAVVVVRGERIEAVGPRGSVAAPAGATVVDGKGKTLIPGLINAHGHVGMTKGLVQDRANYGRENILAHLRQYGRYGVTTVMSLGTDFAEIFPLRGPAQRGEEPRATVLTAGRGFTGKSGYPAVLPGNAGLPREVDSVEEVRAAVAELAKQKVDMVKIWVDDHFGHYLKIRPELYEAIIKEAHGKGLRVMAHLYYLGDAKRLVRAGLDGMAHSVRDREVDAELIGLLKERGTFAVPTLTRELSTFVYATPPAWLDDPFFSRWLSPDVVARLKDPATARLLQADPDFAKYPGMLTMAQTNLKKLSDAGVKIAFGTDTGPPRRFQGFFEHLELELMVGAGLTPAQALAAATSSAAQSLGIAQETGTIAKGKRADLILLDASPLADIKNTRKIRQVWIGGRAVNRT